MDPELDDAALARSMLRSGRSMSEAIDALEARGVPHDKAVEIAARESAGSAESAGGSSDVVIGGLICAVGVAVTAVSYSAASASSGGGAYVVAWGAIVFGAVRMFRGLLR